MGAIRIDLVRSTEAFLALESEWKALFERCDIRNVFLTWEWISAWWRHFSKDTNLWVMASRLNQSGELVGVAPLVLYSRYFTPWRAYRELRLMGSGVAAADHLDFLIAAEHQDEMATAFASYLWETRDQWDVLRLDSLVPHSPVVGKLQRRFTHGPNYRHAIPSPYIRLPTDWETYLKRLGKTMRYNIGRYDRHLQKHKAGEASYRKITDDEALEPGLNSLFHLHQQSQQNKGHAGAFHDPHMTEFHREVARTFLRRGWLRLYLLSVGEADIAALYCFHFRDTVTFYQSGYDLTWRNYGPGRQIMAHAIGRSIADGASEFDFLRGDEAYKSNWATESREDLYLKIPSGALGRLSVYTYAAARQAKHMIKQSVKRLS
ncbi:MAG TPA: GNAT family N-acetyltransferase [Anaerolineales bacterium]|nr:GNAT family N-acetyltransferase [Anaerolineales bacterium]